MRAWSAPMPGHACPAATSAPAPRWLRRSWPRLPTVWRCRRRCAKRRNSPSRRCAMLTAPAWGGRCPTASSGRAARARTMSEPLAASPGGGVVPGAEPVSVPGALRGLYAVTPDIADTARLLALSEQVLAGKPALLQYRNKTADAALRREQARALQRVGRAAGVPFITTADLALALESDADGAPLGREEGPPAAARTALGTQRILGLTCY